MEFYRNKSKCGYLWECYTICEKSYIIHTSNDAKFLFSPNPFTKKERLPFGNFSSILYQLHLQSGTSQL